MQGVSQIEVFVDGALQYRIRDLFSMQMAGNVTIMPMNAVIVEDGVAFILRHEFISGRGMAKEFTVTPVLK